MKYNERYCYLASNRNVAASVKMLHLIFPREASVYVLIITSIVHKVRKRLTN